MPISDESLEMPFLKWVAQRHWTQEYKSPERKDKIPYFKKKKSYVKVHSKQDAEGMEEENGTDRLITWCVQPYWKAF